MTEIVCFMIEATDRQQTELRATHIVEKRYHQAIAVVGEGSSDEHGGVAACFPEFKDDPRWPVQCECGHVFLPSDNRYVDRCTLYRRIDTGEVFTLSNAPLGAMWLADWYPEKHRGPDGLSLIVNTPGGHWMVDQKAPDGSGWTRTGTPPNVTANPSILFHPHRYEGDPEPHGGYHGWLRDGRLVEC
jgi:hypothetical protein